jgi:subtilisin family serine protease
VDLKKTEKNNKIISRGFLGLRFLFVSALFLVPIVLFLVLQGYFSGSSLGNLDGLVSQGKPYFSWIGFPLEYQKKITGRGVFVAVIDEGFEMEHPALCDNFADLYAYSTEDDWDVSSTKGYVGNRLARDSHGTHVAGVIAGRGSYESQGIAPESKIIPIKFIPSMREQSFVKALGHVARTPAKVLNISMNLGLGYIINEEVREAFFQLAQKDVLIVVAAGNDGQSLSQTLYGRSLLSLAKDPRLKGKMLLVGATTLNKNGKEEKASFSAYPGQSFYQDVFLAAPGEEVLSTFAYGNTGKMSGTSMAAPMVVGVAALLRQQFPYKTAQEIKDALLAGARRQTKDGSQAFPELYGSGLLDFEGAWKVLCAGDMKH